MNRDGYLEEFLQLAIVQTHGVAEKRDRTPSRQIHHLPGSTHKQLGFPARSAVFRSRGLENQLPDEKGMVFLASGHLFRHLGGIPVYRSKHTSLTDNLAADAKAMDTFKLCITPEGTRSANADWKKGFLVIAKKADIPILLYGVDYERKLIECTETMIPSDDIEGDLSRIKAYFKNFKGKHPENFKV